MHCRACPSNLPEAPPGALFWGEGSSAASLQALAWPFLLLCPEACIGGETGSRSPLNVQDVVVEGDR